MREFAGRVAVVTGASRGIGRSIAERCVSEKMKVVLVGRDSKALASLQDELRAQGGTALVVQADVSDYEQVASLARRTIDEFGAVHLLVNNAGLAGLEDLLKPVWEVPLSEWEQTLSVNLWGVIHGIHAFTPIMLEQDDACHIVNVSSISGLHTGRIGTAYHTTKHGVVVISEALYKGLQERGSSIGVTVICPGPVSTDIVGRTMQQWTASSRKSIEDWSDDKQKWLSDFEKLIKGEGMDPGEFSNQLFEAIREDQFYVLTHPGIKEEVRMRMEDILEERQPTMKTTD